MRSKTLVAYFSREGNNYVDGEIVNLPVGNTEVAAKMIERLAGGELFKIGPVKKYSSDYMICTNEAKAELSANASPELSSYPDGLEIYDTVILCYPNWWGTMPMPVWSFLEKYDFTGKTILPLCTHEGSGMGHSERDINKLCPGAKLGKGLAVRGTRVKGAENEITAWLSKQRL